MPEPEFFITLLVSGGIFAIAIAIANALHRKGQRENSKTLQWLAALPLGCGLIVFAPMFLLLLGWIYHWIFGGDLPAPSQEP